MVWGWWFSCHVRLFAKPWTVAFLLQGIFATQGSNLGVLHFRQFPAFQMDSFLTEPLGKPDKWSRKAQMSGPPPSPNICYMDNGEKG